MIMDNKINIAELLKDCPKGMELDCTVYNNVTLEYVYEPNSFPICVRVQDRGTIFLSKYGQFHDESYCKCIIFPKGKTTWEGFVPPCQFKDGDVVTNIQGAVIIYKKITTSGYCGSFVSLDHYNKFIPHYESYLTDTIRLATEEEKQKLFDAIKAHGYKWNEETKTLEKLPKFKVGNRIKYINGKNKDGVEQGVILSLTNDTYDVAVTNDMGIFIPISEQDDWELVPNKFDITTLKVFDKVLVRDSNKGMWSASIFSHTWENKYICSIGIWYNQCIPYEENKHLLGTANDCDEYYKTW